MRFAYIDSQGNEVSIPSVDALALRIELGAIGPDTQLYDAQADQWGPASSHEIFHTLSREKGGEGFVAPPPVIPPPVAEEPEEPEEEVAAEEPAEDDLGLDLAFELTEPSTSDPDPEEEPAADAMDFGMDLGDGPGQAAPVADAGAAAEEAEEAFDFGDMGALEVEGAEPEEPEAAAPTGGGMKLEEPLADAMDFGSGAADAGGFGGAMELESPMSEFGTDSSPAWMEQDGPAGGGGAAAPAEDDGSMDFSSPSADGDEGEEREPKKRPEPRTRPSPPRRRRRKLGPLIMGIVVVGGLGAGGYYGWPLAQEWWANRPEPVEEGPPMPDVVIPDIPPELLPTMRDLAEASLSDLIAELSGMQSEFDLAPELRNEWLSGAYLANAGNFPDVEEYWLGIEAFVDRVRQVDAQAFHDKYVARVSRAGIVGDTAAILVERADSGFVAARAGRFEAYNQMDDLVNASLDLHMFLIDNEADIEYEPAAGGLSRDPVLEAIPSNDALGDEMWAMVGNITRALDNLGTLNAVTTERLLAVLFDRIRRAGVQ